MIVREAMTTGLVTSDKTLGHAANLLRQHQFHHLPVVQIHLAPLLAHLQKATIQYILADVSREDDSHV